MIVETLIFAAVGGAQLLPEEASRVGESPVQLWLSLGVLGFGLVLVGLQILVMLKRGSSWGPHTVRLHGLTLAVIAGVFLVTAGYSQQQIAPMIGLLGTIVGYLLGQRSEAKPA